ncbi:unnamed protein product [Absidia cylindrospora]
MQYTNQTISIFLRRTTAAASPQDNINTFLPSNETIQRFKYQYQQQQQERPQKLMLDEPFKMMLTAPSSSNNKSGPDQAKRMDDGTYWMNNKPTRSFSQPPKTLANNRHDTNNDKLSEQQRQSDDFNALFSRSTFPSAVNTPLPPSPVIPSSPEFTMSSGSFENSYAFSLAHTNILM